MRLRTFSLLLVALTMMRAVSAMAFSLLGSNAVWQTDDIFYQQPGDIGGPQYRNEEYRRVHPHVVYRFDNSFVRDFGARGMAEVRKAFNVMNSLGSVDSWSASLSEFPKDAARQNFSATAQNLVDLKSQIFFYALENLGLADSIRYTWTIRNAYRQTDYTNFYVIQMNYDPITWLKTPYVNGRANTYQIQFYTNPNRQDAGEFPVGRPYSPNLFPAAANVAASGYYYNGISYDDAGGLRYIYRASNYKYEYITNAVVTPALLVMGSYNNANGYTIPNFGTNVYTDIWGNAITNTIVGSGWRAGLGRISFVEYDEGYPSNFVNWDDRVWNDDPSRNYYAQSVLQTITRIVPKTVPDLAILSSDPLGSGWNVFPMGWRSVRWRSNAAENGDGFSNGPGQSDTGNTVTLFNQHSMYYGTVSSNSFFLSEDNSYLTFRYGSFDGSTNAPYIHTR